MTPFFWNLLSLLPLAAALPQAGESNNAAPAQGPGVVRLPLVPFEGNATKLVKRADGTVEAELFPDSWKIYFAVELTVGTPGQKVYADIDTGSPHTWLIDSPNDAARSGGKTSFSFDSSKSNTFRTYTGHLNTSYLGNKRVQLYPRRDIISLGSASLGKMLFAVTTPPETQLDRGLIGLSFPESDSPLNPFVDQMVSAGLIGKRVFSVDISDGRYAEGSIVFGGVDTKKFTGTMSRHEVRPVRKSRGVEFWYIKLSEVSFSSNGKKTVLFDSVSNPLRSSSAEGIDVILDTGAPTNHLPLDLMDTIIQTLNSNGIKTQEISSGNTVQYYKVDCLVRRQRATFSFRLDQTRITAPLRDFIMTASGSCYLMFAPASSESANILGVGFMKSAYIVYDMDDRSVHMAQRSWRCVSEKNTVPIYGAEVPKGDC